MITDDINTAATDTLQSAQHLAKLNVDKAKLDVAEGLSVVSVRAITAIVKLIIMCNVVFFISMGLAFVIGDLTGIQSLGFFIIGALFVVVLFVFKFLRKSMIESRIVRMYIDILFKKNENNENR